MSEFKWVPDFGDKFFYNDHKCVALGDGLVVDGEKCNRCFFNFSEREFDAFDTGGIKDWPVYIEPRGKKTKARYAAAKARWESEQNQIRSGGWVVCVDDSDTSGDLCRDSLYKVAIFPAGSSSDTRIELEGFSHMHYYSKRFRKATPAEIEAHELSLKPSVEQLRIELDAAADALAGYCCGIYPKGENIHLEKFKEAKAAHLQAAGGEG